MKINLRIRILSFLLSIVLCLSCAACGASGETAPTDSDNVSSNAVETTPAAVTVKDMLGQSVAVPAELTRVACVSGTEYTILMVLGVADTVVATNQYLNAGWLPRVSPSVADAAPAFGAELNMETLAASNPQLIVTYASDDDLESYSNAGISYYQVGTSNTRENVKDEVAALAELFGAEERGQTYIQYFDEKTNYLHDGLASLDPAEYPTVLNVYSFDGNQTYKTTGGSMAQNSDIEDAGGINVAGTEVEKFGDITAEQIAQWDPDYIIYNGTTEAMEDFMEKFPSLKAVSDGNVFLEPGGVWGWSGISAENILQPLYLATLLHPDLFPDLDIRNELKEFYATFYDYTLTDDEVDLIMNAEDPA